MASQERHACLAHRGGVFALPEGELHYAPDMALEPEHLALWLTLDLLGERAHGDVVHTFVARREGVSSGMLHAEALRDVTVSGLTDEDALTWHYDGHEVHLAFERPLALGERRRVRVGYTVASPSTGLLFSRPTPAHPEAPLFAATDSETERARHWMPCVDLPSARPRVEVHLRAAAALTLLGPGVLVSEVAHGDGTKTAHWKLDAPCPSYLTCFVAGDLVREDDGEEAGVPIAYFATRGFDGAHLRRAFGRTRPMLAWMTRKLGRPYPYPKYFQVALPRIGGAMENISLVTWDDRFLLDEPLALEWSRLVDQINAHEMAHSYFGDLVVIRDFAHAWLKESWATFMEQCWFEDEVSADEGRYELLMNADAYFEEADTAYARPIVLREFSSSFDLYDRHLYPGGACRLHMLRALVGPDAFWVATRRYIERYAEKVVETDDFRRVMEEVSGLSLARFFDEWLLRPGYPVLKATHRFDPAKRESTLELEQSCAAGTPPVFFTMDVEVGFVDAAGAMSLHTVAMTRARHVLVVPLGVAPAQVRIDPNAKVLCKVQFDPGVAMLKVQLRAAPDVTGRIQAGRTLCDAGVREGLEAVAAAYAEEPFWGVRVEWARALGASGTELGLAALARAIGEERDARVLEALFRAALGVRDAGLAQAVETRVREDATLGPRARAAAYEALGNQRADAPLRLLLERSHVADWSGFAQSGAFLGLAATRHEDARIRLLSATRGVGTHERARAIAVTALGRLGRLREKVVARDCAERCADLLRDGDVRVRDAAVEALVGLGAVDFEEALRTYARGQSKQHAVRTLRAVARMRSGAGGPGVALAEEAIAALRAHLRRVEADVAKLQGQAVHGPKRSPRRSGRPAPKAGKP